MDNYALMCLANDLKNCWKSLEDVKGMPLPDESITREHGNSLIAKKLNYDVDELKSLHEEQVQALNPN